MLLRHFLHLFGRYLFVRRERYSKVCFPKLGGISVYIWPVSVFFCHSTAVCLCSMSTGYVFAISIAIDGGILPCIYQTAWSRKMKANDLLMSCEPFLYNSCEIWQEMKGLGLVRTLNGCPLSMAACVLLPHVLFALPVTLKWAQPTSVDLGATVQWNCWCYSRNSTDVHRSHFHFSILSSRLCRYNAISCTR